MQVNNPFPFKFDITKYTLKPENIAEYVETMQSKHDLLIEDTDFTKFTQFDMFMFDEAISGVKTIEFERCIFTRNNLKSIMRRIRIVFDRHRNESNGVYFKQCTLDAEPLTKETDVRDISFPFDPFQFEIT